MKSKITVAIRVIVKVTAKVTIKSKVTVAIRVTVKVTAKVTIK